MLLGNPVWTLGIALPHVSLSPCLPLPAHVPKSPSQESCIVLLAVGPPWLGTPGCQGNVTHAARALSTCQDAARAGRRRQNFQTIGRALSCPTRCLPQHHMAATSGTASERKFPWEKKTRRFRYMSLGPACFVFVAVVRFVSGLPGLALGPPGRSCASALCPAELCGNMGQLTAGEEVLWP